MKPKTTSATYITIPRCIGSSYGLKEKIKDISSIHLSKRGRRSLYQDRAYVLSKEATLYRGCIIYSR